jgi:hypothetical protein
MLDLKDVTPPFGMLVSFLQRGQGNWFSSEIWSTNSLRHWKQNVCMHGNILGSWKSS